VIEQVKNTIAGAVKDLTSELLKVEDFFTTQEKELYNQDQEKGQETLRVIYSGYTPQIWVKKPKREWYLFPSIVIDPVTIKTFKEHRQRRRTSRLWTGEWAFYFNHKQNLVNTFLELNQDKIDKEYEVNGVMDLLQHNLCSDKVNLKRTRKGLFEFDFQDNYTRAFKLALNYKLGELIKEKVNTVSDLIQELKPLSRMGFDTSFGWDESQEASQITEAQEFEKIKSAFAWSRKLKEEKLTDSDGFNWETGQPETQNLEELGEFLCLTK